MELTVSLRTRKPCELEQDGMYTERLASQAQFLPLIVILKVSIINLKAKPVWLDAETHWPVGSEGFSRRQSGTQRTWMAHTVSFTTHKFFWVLSDKNVYWVVFLGVVFFCLHKAAQVAPPLSHLLIKEAHKGEVSLLEGDGGGSWQAAGVREPGR